MIVKKRGLTITVAVALLLTMLPVALFSATAAAPQSADELTKNMPKSVLQDFKNFTIKQGETVHRWPYSPHNNYNDEQGVELLVDADGKGLYVANDKNKKGEAAFWVYAMEKAQFPAGQYLAVTLKKNSVKDSFEAAFALGTSGFGFIVPAATDVYYDNGSGTLKIAAPVGGTDSRTYKAGTADTVTVYLPVDKFVRSANGETVTITMDTTLPRYYGRGLCIHGTQAYYNEWNDSLYLDGVHNQHDFEPKPLWGNAEEYEKEYQHPLWDKYAPTGGHGGMDWLVYSAFVDCVKRGIEPPVDVYDTATYMAVTALSEASIAIGGAPVAFPDFTEGRYLGREPMPETKYCLHKIFE